MSEPFDTSIGLSPVKEGAEALQQYGTDRVFTSLVLILILATASLGFWYWRRVLSGKYIAINDIPAWMHKNRPELMRRTPEELPCLSNHEVFASWQQILRDADSLIVYVSPQSDDIDDLRTQLARDLVQWSIRAWRNTFEILIKEAYDNKKGFEEYFGDQKGFQHTIQAVNSDIQVGIRNQLVENLQFPSIVYDHWIQSRAKHQELLKDLLQIATGNHDTNYWRLNEVMTSLFGHSQLLSDEVVRSLERIPHSLEEIKYTRKAESTFVTMPAFREPQQNSSSRIFENSYKPRR